MTGEPLVSNTELERSGMETVNILLLTFFRVTQVISFGTYTSQFLYYLLVIYTQIPRVIHHLLFINKIYIYSYNERGLYYIRIVFVILLKKIKMSNPVI